MDRSIPVRRPSSASFIFTMALQFKPERRSFVISALLDYCHQCCAVECLLVPDIKKNGCHVGCGGCARQQSQKIAQVAINAAKCEDLQANH